MTITKAILSVGLTALLFGVAGGLVGYGIGRFFPGYYRQVFYIRDPQVTPEDLGVGLGITQGLMWGIVTGLILVLIIAWKETRLARTSTGERGQGSTTTAERS
jgi:hypothetical protein